MKHAIIYIGILLLTLSCTKNTFQLQMGDLLFQANDSSSMSDAISASTGSNGSLDFSHVAIVIQKNGEELVLEASSEGGVRVVTLADFLTSSSKIGQGRAVIAMRLRDTTGVAASVRQAQSYIGQPYDFFYTPQNGRIYCSELVYESYRDSSGVPLFTARPMNFRDSSGIMPTFWIELFEQLGEPIPEGVAGTNPNDMSKEANLREVHRYF